MEKIVVEILMSTLGTPQPPVPWVFFGVALGLGLALWIVVRER